MVWTRSCAIWAGVAVQGAVSRIYGRSRVERIPSSLVKCGSDEEENRGWAKVLASGEMRCDFPRCGTLGREQGQNQKLGLRHVKPEVLIGHTSGEF